MKYCATHFEEYINESQRINLHPKNDKIYTSNFPKNLFELKNSGLNQLLPVIRLNFNSWYEFWLKILDKNRKS